ncbi:hypothetical protein [Mycolicibacterium fortuitum]|uniref:hypothetical protein n=1 Tax=Mycolicibacterium fortuitum TaxID=1766 RepID=UPI0007EA6948|nr:hypothetical protein [Mycolicibacterium fortuitum]OBB53126.1 hypothetical protein A5754_21600 [Mycolicibacterium fortuitum]OBB74842.1 hypothetical protein A5755_14235 [Mycolicibacterium fortuitum]OBF84971.1 hypothetical protein A5751_10610 [Mycolicibacterium fortuitum]
MNRTVLLCLPRQGVDITDQDQLEPYLSQPLATGEVITGLVMTAEGMAVRVTAVDGEEVPA